MNDIIIYQEGGVIHDVSPTGVELEFLLGMVSRGKAMNIYNGQGDYSNLFWVRVGNVSVGPFETYKQAQARGQQLMQELSKQQ